RLSRSEHGHGECLRSSPAAVGDGLFGPDAGNEADDVEPGVDRLATGRVAGLCGAAAAVGVYHRQGLGAGGILSAGAQADEAPAGWPAVSVGVGARFLSRVRLPQPNGRGVVWRVNGSGGAVVREDAAVAAGASAGSGAGGAFGVAIAGAPQDGESTA